MKKTQSQISFNNARNNAFYRFYFDNNDRVPFSPQSPNSLYSHDLDELLKLYDELRHEIRKLKNDVKHLKQEVRGVAEESSMWTLKYSRRFVFTSNILLAIYLLSNRILQVLNDHSRSLLSSVINPFTWLSYSRKNRSVTDSIVRPEKLSSYKTFKRQFINTMKGSDSIMDMASERRNSGSSIQYVFLKLIWKQLILAGLLIFSSYWAGNARVNWKRKVGIALSFFTNVHLALTSDVSPWTIYLNCFTLLLYITARHIKNKPLPVLLNLKRSISLNSFQTMQEKLLEDESYERYKVINFNYSTTSSSSSSSTESASKLKTKKRTTFSDSLTNGAPSIVVSTSLASNKKEKEKLERNIFPIVADN
jgi:hypothetical protein